MESLTCWYIIVSEQAFALGGSQDAAFHPTMSKSEELLSAFERLNLKQPSVVNGEIGSLIGKEILGGHRGSPTPSTQIIIDINNIQLIQIKIPSRTTCTELEPNQSPTCLNL